MRTLLPIPCLILAAAFLLLPIPAGATLVLSGAALSPPDLPLTRGEALGVDAGIAIIPSGAQTFATGHSLQIETNLGDARWSTTVMVDGNPAARQSGTGAVIFVNGYVLSYPTNRDVALDITLEGTVPADAGLSLMVMSVKELDNGGAAVPGSQITVTEPVVPPATPVPPAPETIPVPPAVPGTPPASPSPTAAGGDALSAGLLAAGALTIFGLFRNGRI